MSAAAAAHVVSAISDDQTPCYDELIMLRDAPLVIREIITDGSLVHRFTEGFRVSKTLLEIVNLNAEWRDLSPEFRAKYGRPKLRYGDMSRYITTARISRWNSQFVSTEVGNASFGDDDDGYMEFVMYNSYNSRRFLLMINDDNKIVAIVALKHPSEM